jgi:hypothetical protein
MSITITGEKAPKPSIRDPPSGTFCLVRSIWKGYCNHEAG